MSAAVLALQLEVGVPLVVKDGRGIAITSAGTVLAGYARTVLGLLEEARHAVVAAADPTAGRIRIAAVTTAAEQILPSALAAFRRDSPRVELELEVVSRDRVWALLAAHEADVVIAGRPPAGTDGRVRGTRPNDLVAVAAPDVPTDPAAVTWLVREPGSGTRATTMTYLGGLEVSPPVLSLGSNGAVVAGAVAGLGMTLVARDAVRRELAEGRLVVVDLPGTPIARPWHLVTSATAGPTVELLIAHLLTEVFTGLAPST